MTDIALKLVREESIVLDNVSGWVGLFEYAFLQSPETVDARVLSALLRHDRYRDDYIGPTSHERTTEQKHGPYDLSRLMPGDFAPVPGDDAAAEMDSFIAAAQEYGSSPAPVGAARVLAAGFDFAAPSLYSLAWRRELPEHDSGFLLDGDWHEFVAIDLASGRLQNLIGFTD